MNRFAATIDVRIPGAGLVSLLVLFLVLGTTRVASGQDCPGSSFVLISQPQDYANGFKSDATGNPQVVAEQLVVAEDTLLSSVKVWGGFGPNNTPSNSFTLVVHLDSGGLPGGTIYSESGIATTLVATGVTFPPPLVPLSEYEATLTPAAPVVLPAGVVWFEIYNDAAGGDAWYWLTGTLDPVNGIAGSGITFSAPGGTWHNLNPDMAILACGDVFSPGSPMCFCDPGNPTGNTPPCGNFNDGSDPLGAGCQHDDSAAGARLYASGVASVTGDTLVLEAIRGPIQDSSLFFQANNDLDGSGSFLGDGLRCAGGGLIRLKVKTTDANGFADSSPMVISTRSASFGHTITPGETLYYQWWFRDSGGSPCSTESNTSNGYTITWAP